MLAISHRALCTYLINHLYRHLLQQPVLSCAYFFFTPLSVCQHSVLHCPTPQTPFRPCLGSDPLLQALPWKEFSPYSAEAIITYDRLPPAGHSHHSLGPNTWSWVTALRGSLLCHSWALALGLNSLPMWTLSLSMWVLTLSVSLLSHGRTFNLPRF